ncbi:MAG TPA: cysteine desulfurase [Acidobacteriota bacterium]|nr:cysteine desulfurase [Acidobacteriota bacterium]
MAFPIENIRKDFPVLQQTVHGKSLIYFDNAATALKPQAVIDAINHYYSTESANVHRGIYYLSEKATAEFEGARDKVREFLNASSPQEIIFVRGTTEAINLVASSYVKPLLREGDEIVLSVIEHHSNIVPWQIVCNETGAKLRIIPANDDGELGIEEYEKLLNAKTKFVSIGHVSNAIGTINPVKKIIEIAHSNGTSVLIDGAQAVPHLTVDVQELDCDFYAFSGHKIYGPTGIGVLYGKAQLLDQMKPYHGGGEMISSVSFEKTTYKKPPYKFEAGTPSIADAIGLAAALDYVSERTLKEIAAYEKDLLTYASAKLMNVAGLRIIGKAKSKSAIISFVIDEIHPHDIGTILDQEGIAIRAGHHCAMPAMQRFGVPATARASFAFYNTKEEIDSFVKSLDKVLKIFS